MGLLVGAAVLYIPVYLLGGREGFLKTLSVMMYGVTPLLLTSWIFGNLGIPETMAVLRFACILYVVLFFGWSAILMVKGLREIYTLTQTRSTLAVGIATVALFVISIISILALIAYIQGFHGLEINPHENSEQDPLRFEMKRLDKTIIVTNMGWQGQPVSQISRLEVSQGGIVRGVLGLEKNSTLAVPAPSCPADIQVDAYYDSGMKRTLEHYREESCGNHLVNIAIHRYENSMQVDNNGGPRIDEISAIEINVMGVGTYLLGSARGSIVTIPVPGRPPDLTITALLTNGASWKIASTHMGSFQQSQTYTFLTAVTTVPPGVCAAEGERIGAVGWPDHCCDGLDPLGGWPGDYTGSCLVSRHPVGSVCSDCGDGVCNASTGENHCNCKVDCK